MLAYDGELYNCYMAYISYMPEDNDSPLQTFRDWRESKDPIKEAFVMGWMAKREYDIEPGYEGDEESLKEL